jgi:AmmeMemoRadiSam system protein B
LEKWKPPALSPERDAGEAETGFNPERSGGLAAVSPHAGWYYSGAIAAAAFASLDGGAETVAILGGHLAAPSPVLTFTEDAFAGPLGPMEIDGELRDALCSTLERAGGLSWAPDLYRDNTVEVLIPMARYFFPRARLLALRLPADPASYETGRLLAETARALKRRLVVVGSTDLTHYGRNYGFSPRGRGAGALAFVREVNDRRFIDAVLSGDPRTVLSRAEGELSACSAGAVLGVLGFVQHKSRDTTLRGGIQDRGHGTVPDRDRNSGPAAAELLAYGTSADRDNTGEIPDSFVGYAAVGWK